MKRNLSRAFIGMCLISFMSCSASEESSIDETGAVEEETTVISVESGIGEAKTLSENSSDSTLTESLKTDGVEDTSLNESQRNAVRSAKSYLDFSGFSRQGLIDQLSSEYGDQFLVADATAAVDSLNVDWKAEAVQTATSYLDMSGFSCAGLIEQMTSDYGDKYTLEEATYGAAEAGAC
jgi:hypothetical protein